MVEPGENFDDRHDEEPFRPLLPADDRLWRHPSEMGPSVEALSSDEVLAARHRWLTTTPSRAGAGAGALVGALLATGVVLIGIHLSSWLTPDHGVRIATQTDAELPTTTAPAVHSQGLTPVIDTVNAALVQVRAFRTGKWTLGDGVIISPNGFVLAPSSMIEGASSVSIVRSDGEELIARVIGADAPTGLSVLHFDEGSPLPYVHFATTRSASLGALMLLAWRSPSVSDVSLASMETLPDVTSISNGPALLDVCPPSLKLSTAPDGALILDGSGRVLGIVTAHRGSQAIAAPGWLAARIADDLMTDGHVTHGWLGIEGVSTHVAVDGALSRPSSVSSSAIRENNLTGNPADNGVRVVDVMPNSAAAHAGLHQGDVIAAVDNEPVSTMAGLQAVLYLMSPATQVKLEVVRGGQVSEVSTRLQAAA